MTAASTVNTIYEPSNLTHPIGCFARWCWHCDDAVT
jgi:hypothetical protein